MDLVKLEGWDLDTSTDEPRVRDLDVAKRAGLTDPHAIRRTIEKNWDELTAHGEVRVSDRRSENGRGRPSLEYWLTEAQAVALVSMLKTPAARALRVALVKLFVAYRRGQLVQVPPVQLEVVHGPRVGDVPNLKADASSLCAMTARAGRYSLPAVHGFIRRTYRVSGIHQIAVIIWPTVKQTLEQVALGRITIGLPARKALPPDRRQVEMFGAN